MTQNTWSGSKGAALSLALTILLLVLALVIPPGFYTIDEVAYGLGAIAMAETGSFIVETGWAEYRSEDLKLWFLVEGPGGLVPQYPPGSALAGVPFVSVFGLRGLILLNALAAAAALWLTSWLAMRAYGDRRIALLAPALLAAATFLPEYALAIWPHATSLALGLGALVLAIRASDSNGRPAFACAVASGLTVAVGMAFRVDTMLVLAPIGVHVVLYAARPVLALLGGAFGLGVGLVALTLINGAKFGIYSPLTYGSSDGGGIDPSSHLAGAAVLALGGIGLIALRAVRWTPARGTLAGGGILIAATAAIAIVPEVRAALMAYVRGLYALGFDITTVHETRNGVVDVSERTRLFWGRPKKALVQSLPWIALIIFLVAGPRTAKETRWTVTWLAAIVACTLPFAMSQWHGGFGANMRYFLPMLPFLCLFAATAAVRLQDRAEVPVRVLVLAGAAGGGLAALWVSMGLNEALVLNQVVTRYVFVALMLLVIGSAMAGARLPWMGKATMATFAGAVGLSAYIAQFQDTALALKDRADSVATRAAAASLSEPALFHGPPEFLLTPGQAPRHLVGIYGRRDQKIDYDLIAKALEEGRRVFIWDDYVQQAIDRSSGRLRAVAPRDFGPSEMIEVTDRPARTARAPE